MDSKSNSAPGPGRASPADERAMTPGPAVSPVALREELDTLFDELWPLPRSITGEGTRKTLELLGGRMGMQFDYVASGTPVFDWTTPPVWRVRAARLTGPDGAVVADFEQDNLSIINYAAPVDRELELEELQPHLHSIPQLPDATPYVTSYYQPRWGFCLPHARRLSLKPGRYHAFIDSDFEGEGGVPFAHVRLPGESEAEVMLTSYVCHPSLANNELSGPLTLLGIYRMLTAWPRRRFSYRRALLPVAPRGRAPTQARRRRCPHLPRGSEGEAQLQVLEAGGHAPRRARVAERSALRAAPVRAGVRGRRAPVRLTRIQPARRSVQPHGVR